MDVVTSERVDADAQRAAELFRQSMAEAEARTASMTSDEAIAFFRRGIAREEAKMAAFAEQIAGLEREIAEEEALLAAAGGRP